MKRIAVVLTIIGALAGVGTLCCRETKEVESFYLRSCETGRLIGPIRLAPGYLLPPLSKKAYIVADPTESEIDVRNFLLKALAYETHHIDCTVDDVIETIHHMLKRRLGDKVPPFRIEGVDALITIHISGEASAYDVLCDIAAMTKAHIFIEDGAVVLSRAC